MRLTEKRLWPLLALAVVVALTVACPGKEEPGPDPEPTAAPTIVVLTPVPGADAVCYSPGDRPGAPPYCENSLGEIVTCPSDIETRRLAACP
jgi:hypothetical protein